MSFVLRHLSSALLSVMLLGTVGHEAAAASPGRQQQPTKRPATRQAAACILTNDTLAGQPFGTEPTVAELLRAGGSIVARQPCVNLHEANQIDTIIVLRHAGNAFEFYRCPDKDLLRQAIITNFRPPYGQRLRHNLASAQQSGGTCGQLRIRDTERANNVSVTFSGGQPSVARVQPYWD